MCFCVAAMRSQLLLESGIGCSQRPNGMTERYAESLPETKAYPPAAAGETTAPRTIQGNASDSSQDNTPVVQQCDEYPKVPGYEILGLLGRGGMGIVYKARHVSLSRLVALKFLLLGSDEASRSRFQTEAQATARLQHPNIVQVFEVGTVTQGHYLALEFVDGGSLAHHLHGEPQPFEKATRWSQTLALATAHAHREGVVHRDLKPANILLSGIENGPSTADLPLAVPKIADFGLAKWVGSEAGQTVSGAILGTPSYMAPEQALGQGHVAGPSADIYALGAILYEMLTGKPPFRGSTLLETLDQVRTQEPVRPGRLRPNLPRDLETICLKCLQKKPAQRYRTAEALAEDLRRFQNGEPILARPIGAAARTWRWCRRNPIVASLSAVLLLVVLGGLLAVTYLWLDAETERKAALANLDEADRQRKLYEESFRSARAAVDEFVRASEGELFNKPGLEDARRKMFEIAVTYHQAFIRLRGDDPSLQGELAHYYEHMGNLLGAGQEQEALALHEKALAIREQLSHARPQDVELQADVASSYHNIGGKTADPREAIDYYQKSVSILERLSQDDPSVSKFQANLAKAYSGIGNVHHKNRRPIEATSNYELSIRLQESLTAREPENNEFRLDLATSLNNLGILQGETNKFADAHASFARTEKLYASLAKAQPDNHVFQNGRAMALRGMGMALSKQERREEAIATFQEAIRQERLALGMAGVKGRAATQYRKFLRSDYSLLAGVLRDLGRPAQAVKFLLESRSLAVGESDALVRIAEGVSLCIPLVGKDPANLTEAERTQRKAYEDVAMETLQWAIGAGYDEWNNLKTNLAFVPLRSRSDFRKLLRERDK